MSDEAATDAEPTILDLFEIPGLNPDVSLRQLGVDRWELRISAELRVDSVTAALIIPAADRAGMDLEAALFVDEDEGEG